MATTLIAKNAINDALVALVKTGAGTAALEIYSASDVLLATLALDPTDEGSNDPLAAVITWNPGDPEDDAPATGTASYAVFINKDGNALNDSIPVTQGTSPVAGNAVLSSLDIVAGGMVRLISFTQGFAPGA
jgi:hypothetical protein